MVNLKKYLFAGMLGIFFAGAAISAPADIYSYFHPHLLPDSIRDLRYDGLLIAIVGGLLLLGVWAVSKLSIEQQHQLVSGLSGIFLMMLVESISGPGSLKPMLLFLASLFFWGMVWILVERPSVTPADQVRDPSKVVPLPPSRFDDDWTPGGGKIV